MPYEEITPHHDRRSFSPIFNISWLLALWYSSSICVILVTKALFSGSTNQLPAFPFPLLITATNNVVAYIAARNLAPNREDVHPDPNVHRIALIIGACTASEIGFSNIALNLLAVSFLTILKGMAPFFVMSWSVIFGIRKFDFRMLAIMVLIAVGLGMALSGRSTEKHYWSLVFFIGLMMQLGSAITAGFRWSITQIFIKSEAIGNQSISDSLKIEPLSRSLSAVETILLTAPYSAICIAPFVFLLEGYRLLQWFQQRHWVELGVLLFFLSLIGFGVYVLLYAEYKLVMLTSSLTVSVAYVFKEVLLIYGAFLVFHEQLSGVTIAGFVLVQAAVLAYAILRSSEAR